MRLPVITGLWQHIWTSHFWRRVFSRSNLWALVLCLAIILVIIFTADSAPLWIYQGF